jgi:hypothetical protein
MREPANRHKVPKKVWNKWTPEARKLFNELYSMGADQAIWIHPEMEEVSKRCWDTVRWNFAWMAADMTTSGLKARDYVVI